MTANVRDLVRLHLFRALSARSSGDEELYQSEVQAARAELFGTLPLTRQGLEEAYSRLFIAFDMLVAALDVLLDGLERGGVSRQRLVDELDAALEERTHDLDCRKGQEEKP